MISISLCMIVRDEEETLVRCLESVKDLVDEIIIVDTGSLDRTREIAHSYSPNVYYFAWRDDFSAARNYSFSLATMEYILWLDADDILLEEDRHKFKLLKDYLDLSVDMVMMQYNLGIPNQDTPFCTYYRERLLKRNMDYTWHDPVHEYIEPAGKVISVDIAVSHRRAKENSSRNLKIFQNMLEQGKILSHRNFFYYARELNLNQNYDEAKRYYERFLSGEGGFLFNYIDASIDLSRIYAREGNREAAVKTLIRGFENGIPRAELCCELGSVYQEMEDYYRALSWYHAATQLKKPESATGAVMHDYYGYIPYAAMSICCYKLGMIQEAIKYNEKAAECKPDSGFVINNRQFFASIKGDNAMTTGYRMWP